MPQCDTWSRARAALQGGSRVQNGGNGPLILMALNPVVCGVTRATVFMGALMTNTDLTYDDLAEATAFMADRLLAAQGQVLDLNQQLAAARGEVAGVRGGLGFWQERTRGARNRGGYW